MPVLQFKGKTAIESYHHTVPHHTLKFDGKLSLLGRGEKPGLDGNLIIEGDNLVALKGLLPTHAGRIKSIYIDPPYNTGNEDWVYNDNLTQPQFKEWIGQTVGKEGEDATRHDKWCCMMYPRLQLLKELLRDDGAIFVSIDENEFHVLRMMMDEIFRVEMPLATLVWKRRSPSGMRRDPVSVDHEYVLLYAKDRSQIRLSGLFRTAADYPLEDSKGKYASTDLTIGMTAEDRPHQFYDITNPKTKVKYPGNPNRVWRFEPDVMKQVIEDRLVIWPDEQKDSEMTRPRYKTYFDPANPKIKPLSSWIESSSRSKAEIKEEADDYDVEILTSGLNAEGGRILQRIFGKKMVDYPKPPSLIKSLIRAATSKEDTVLDSFAGSGTTAHALLELNKEDGGNRKFILVQLPYDTKENEKDNFNICEKITAERVRRVIQGYTYSNPKGKKEKVEGLGGSFTYASVGNSLFGEYRDWGKQPPAYEELAKYIFYTETSRDFDRKTMNEKSGKIGEHKGTSYYLLYTSNGQEDRRLDMEWLKGIEKTEKNKNLVVYCEKIWFHRDDLEKFAEETKRKVRPMIVPFNLK
jgi:adenine-specific DNA-methyltransferase